MKTILMISLLLVLVSRPVQAQSEFKGQWLIEYDKDSLIRLTLTNRSEEDRRSWGTSHTTFRVDMKNLDGLSPTQIQSKSGTNVSFRIIRDAGTIQAEGWFKSGEGSGHFIFELRKAFADDLVQRGFERSSEEQQFSMALHDVGFDLINELKAQGYNQPSTRQLVEMGTHGVHLDYVRDIKKAGYALGDVERLIHFRDHGVTPDFIEGLNAAGFTGLSADELVRTRDHGVTPDHIRDMTDLGFTNLSIREFRRMKDHDVSASFVRSMRDRGFKDLTTDELIRLKNSGF